MISGKATGYTTAKPLDYKGLLKACEAALNEGGKSIISDFKGATATWEHRPEFVIRGPFLKKSGGNSVLWIRVEPSTYIDIFTYVNNGTQPHLILPRKGKYLTYKRDFTPKTEAGSLFSRPGGKSGSYTRRLGVAHPGSEARNFTVISAANHQPWWNSRIDRLAYEWGVRAMAGKVTAL